MVRIIENYTLYEIIGVIVPFAETVTLIGTYVQLEGEMRVTQVDVRRPFDVIRLLVSRISVLARGTQLWEIEGEKMQQEMKELIAQKDGLKAENATLQDRIVILERTRSTAAAEDKIKQAKLYKETLKQTLRETVQLRDEVEEELKASTAQVAQLQKDKTEALQQIADVKQENAGIHQEVTKLEEEKREVKEKNAKLNQTVAAFKIQLHCSR